MRRVFAALALFCALFVAHDSFGPRVDLCSRLNLEWSALHFDRTARAQFCDALSLEREAQARPGLHVWNTEGPQLGPRAGLRVEGGFAPTSLPNLAFWVRSDLGVTIVQGPIAATGTTPPTVTLSGSPLNTSSSSIEIDITLLGTLGVAQFQWKFNGVVQQTGQATAASVPLAGTGLTAAFAAGTYAANDVYTSVLTVSSITDQSGNGINPAQATATKQPTYNVGGAGGNPYMGFLNANAQLLTVTKGAIGPTTWTIFQVLQFTATNLNQSASAFGTTGNGNEFHLGNGSNRDVLANAVADRFDGAPTTNVEVWIATNDATTTLFYLNGTLTSLTNSTSNATAAAARTTLGSTAAATTATMSGNIYETGAYTVKLSAVQEESLAQYLGHRYAIAVTLNDDVWSPDRNWLLAPPSNDGLPWWAKRAA